MCLLCFGGLKSLPQRVEVRSSGLAHQPEGLPCAEQAALALRFPPLRKAQISLGGDGGLSVHVIWLFNKDNLQWFQKTPKWYLLI